ncbi:MAG: type II secretion system F family protein [Methylococcales bacterium]|nr:type II secretion system F family protein [Methylococcales bacterium]
MAEFSYKVINNKGETEEGTREAINEQTLWSSLQAEGFMPISVTKGSTNQFLGFNLGGNKNKINANYISLFTDEMTTLLESGLPLDKSLVILMSLNEDNEVFRNLVSQILEKVKGGTSFADALASQSGVFSKFYLNMIRAGEAGGNLGSVLARLSDYMQRSKELKDTVSTALIYPTILLVMSVASLSVMLTFVVPQFSEMFADAGKELPVPTQIVVALSDFLQSYWWLLAGIFTLFYLFMKQQLADPVTKKQWDGRFLKLPLAGEIIKNKETANISRTLGTLLGNGVSILDALSIVKETVGNQVLAEVIDDAVQDLTQGKNMSNALLKSELFPKMAMQMIKVGEETGKLEEMLLKMAEIYDKQLKTTIHRMLALLEPLLIVVLGLMVAGIIASILLAILSVNDLAF